MLFEFVKSLQQMFRVGKFAKTELRYFALFQIFRFGAFLLRQRMQKEKTDFNKNKIKVEMSKLFLLKNDSTVEFFWQK